MGDPEGRRVPALQSVRAHWAEINRVTLRPLSDLPGSRKLSVALENLYQSPNAVAELFRFPNLSYRDGHAAMFARPHNVNRPEDERLDADQTKRFDAIAGDMMREPG